jgi:SAM-dependent methyltransferase
MSVISLLKRFVPAPIRLPLRRCVNLIRRKSPYDSRIQSELETFHDLNVQDLPPVMHYWSNKYLAPMLAPFGFTDAIQFVRIYMARVCRQFPGETVFFLSVGAGTCASEINIAEWLRENSIENYAFECVDINPTLLEKGRVSAGEKNLSSHFKFAPFDVNGWKPARQYHVVVAFQSLHHFVELETLFDKIHRALHPDGYFLTDDMIGRNGHQRWPEALKVVNELWRELPRKYTYNHQLKRFEREYENWDCSTAGFEGIRAQDILPLLVERFHFEFFIGFGNAIDIFIDRGFGPNFDPNNEWDRAFIDRVNALDVAAIEAGRVKPTHMIAAMTKRPVERTAMHKHLSPEFCIRRR